MERATDKNKWLFNNDPNRTIYKIKDHLDARKRVLLNQHLDGTLTAAELQDELKKLREECDE